MALRPNSGALRSAWSTTRRCLLTGFKSLQSRLVDVSRDPWRSARASGKKNKAATKTTATARAMTTTDNTIMSISTFQF